MPASLRKQAPDGLFLLRRLGKHRDKIHLPRTQFITIGRGKGLPDDDIVWFKRLARLECKPLEDGVLLTALASKSKAPIVVTRGNDMVALHGHAHDSFLSHPGDLICFRASKLEWHCIYRLERTRVAGCRVAVIPRGPSVTHTKANIWHKRFQEFGGSVYWGLPQVTSTLTHLVVDEVLTKEDLAQSLDGASVPPSWMLACVKSRCRVSEDIHKWSHPSSVQHPPGHVKEPERRLSGLNQSEEGQEEEEREEEESNTKGGVNMVPYQNKKEEAFFKRNDFLTKRDVVSPVESGLWHPRHSPNSDTPGNGFYSSQDSSIDGSALAAAAADPNSPNKRRRIPKRDGFACHKSGTDASLDHNARITEKLGELSEMYRTVRAGDESKWRVYSFKKAADIIKTLDWPIRTEDDADKLLALHGISQKIVDKVKEIIRTGGLERLKHMKERPDLKAINELMKVWGIGAAKAEELYHRGATDLPTLRQLVKEGKIKLQPRQELGLQYAEDFQQRIPRAEITKIVAIVRKTAQSILPGCIAMACGSYRRGKMSSGDIDILITHPSGPCPILEELVEALFKQGFLLGTLVMDKSKAYYEREVVDLGDDSPSPEALTRTRSAIEDKEYTKSHIRHQLRQQGGQDKLKGDVGSASKKQGAAGQEEDGGGGKMGLPVVKLESTFHGDEDSDVDMEWPSSPSDGSTAGSSQEQRPAPPPPPKQEASLKPRPSAALKDVKPKAALDATGTKFPTPEVVHAAAMRSRKLRPTVDEKAHRSKTFMGVCQIPKQSVKEEVFKYPPPTVPKEELDTYPDQPQFWEPRPFLKKEITEDQAVTKDGSMQDITWGPLLTDKDIEIGGIARRLDIKVYHLSQFPFAVLYFTGSDHFNRSMRLYAKQHEWSLSDSELVPAMYVGDEKYPVGPPVTVACERDVFSFLGLEYKYPWERNVYQTDWQYGTDALTEGPAASDNRLKATDTKELLTKAAPQRQLSGTSRSSKGESETEED